MTAVVSGAVAPAWTPACMDAEELASWHDQNARITTTHGRASGPCTDCTLGYAAEMRAVGRCNGTPGGVEEDEPMETHEAAAIVDAAEIIGRRRITAIAPCPTCVHARVCRLRPADELDVRVSLPALAPELDVTLTATIECVEYVRAKGTKPEAKEPLDRPKKTISPEARERLRQGAAKTQAILAARRAEAAS